MVYCARQRDYDLGLKWGFDVFCGHVFDFLWIGIWKRSGVGRCVAGSGPVGTSDKH